jgi:hypothetical protein
MRLLTYLMIFIVCKRNVYRSKTESLRTLIIAQHHCALTVSVFICTEG